MVKKAIFFLILILGAPLSQPYLLSGTNHEIGQISEEDIELLNELQEEELDNLLSSIIDGMTPPPPPMPKEGFSITFWDKTKLFWSLPFSAKWKLFKDHVKKHRLAYTAGGVGATAGAGFLVYYFHFRPPNENS